MTPTVLRRRCRITGLAALALGFWLSAAAAPPTPTAARRVPNLPAPLTDADYYDQGAPDPLKVELGRLLFYDKLLSGNRNISCATCHHALLDTGDGLSLPVGEGGSGLGVTRETGELALTPIVERVPRNAPPVFNLGVRDFEVMFHDGRVAVNPAQPSGFDSPAGGLLPVGLENVLAAQAMFPVTSPTEMAGQPTENPIANAAAAPADLPLVWELLAARLRDPLNNYSDLFIDAFADVTAPADIQFFHAANAIAAFEAFAWRADDSPFDRFLRGQPSAMTPAARRGMARFYHQAGCAECHSGALLTDLDYHAVAMPQIGPGRGDGYDGHEDYGREQVTLDPADRYRFRTPTLRNVSLTGPWGHAGAYDSLRAMVEHMLDPVAGLEGYDPGQAMLPSRPDLDALDFVVMSDPVRRQEIAGANELAPTQLKPARIDDLLAFLDALTDPASIDLRNDVPAAVPSGLPLVE